MASGRVASGTLIGNEGTTSIYTCPQGKTFSGKLYASVSNSVVIDGIAYQDTKGYSVVEMSYVLSGGQVITMQGSSTYTLMGYEE